MKLKYSNVAVLLAVKKIINKNKRFASGNLNIASAEGNCVFYTIHFNLYLIQCNHIVCVTEMSSFSSKKRLYCDKTPTHDDGGNKGYFAVQSTEVLCFSVSVCSQANRI